MAEWWCGTCAEAKPEPAGRCLACGTHRALNARPDIPLEQILAAHEAEARYLRSLY